MSLDSKRWQQIQDVYYAALERAPDERATFLDEACRGDRQLRIEVDSLISSHQEAGSFLASPALEVAAKTIATEGADPITGKQIGHYKVMALLGRGGMGEVYLAEDTRLGRRVALKLLPAYFTGDEQRLARFQREARAASALNHPNIITIFDIGQSESIHYISAEHIEGETLRQRLSNARMSVTEALDVAIQAASALAAAHEAGIIHRDIKPENVMLRPDGYVKVLDFGLAKLAEGKYSGQSSAPTMANISTDSGIVMGTASYMSPEQARGQKVDARTDIFSLGVVLYEMIAGRQPFEGETAPVVISLILGSEPTPLARYSNEVPQSLEWIITKSLTKNRDERYQTAKDLLVDLKRVRKHLEYEAAREQSAPPRTSSQFDEVTIVAPVTVNTNAGQVGQTAEIKPERTTSSAEVIIGEIKRHKKVAAAALVVLALVLGGIGYQLYRLAGEDKPKAAFQTMKVTRLTTSGNVTQAAISPDGKYVAYTTSAGGQQSIWLKHIPTSSDVQIVPPSKGAYYTDLIFSPDGNFVCYVHNGSAQPANGLYRIPVLGGSPKKVTERVHGGFCFSPDGQRIALTRWKPYTKDSPDNNGEKQLMIINADGSSERRLTSRFAPTVLDNPAWSPDGRVIACTVTGAVDSSASVILVQVEDGSERTNWPQKWFNAGHLAWLQDGSGLVVPASDTPSSPCQIWHISYPGGEARRITNDLNSYNNVSLTSDSRTLVTAQGDQVSNIWTAPDGDSSRAKQVTSGLGKHGAGSIITIAGLAKGDCGGGICWTPDGRIVYHSMASGKADIWIMDAGGANQKQLTADAGFNFYPSVSPDGRYIVFNSDRSGSPSIWRMNIDGTNPIQLLAGNGAFPRCSTDSKWVICSNSINGVNNVVRVPIEGGEPEGLNDTKGTQGRPDYSPDGKQIACNYIANGSTDWYVRMAIIPSGGGEPVKSFDIFTLDIVREIHWTPDGRALTYIETRDGVSNIWGQPVEGGPPKQLTDFKSDLIFSFDWSRDGRLACSRGTQPSDAVLISDFK